MTKLLDSIEGARAFRSWQSSWKVVELTPDEILSLYVHFFEGRYRILVGKSVSICRKSVRIAE